VNIHRTRFPSMRLIVVRIVLGLLGSRGHVACRCPDLGRLRRVRPTRLAMPGGFRTDLRAARVMNMRLDEAAGNRQRRHPLADMTVELCGIFSG